MYFTASRLIRHPPSPLINSTIPHSNSYFLLIPHTTNHHVSNPHTTSNHNSPYHRSSCHRLLTPVTSHLLSVYLHYLPGPHKISHQVPRSLSFREYASTICILPSSPRTFHLHVFLMFYSLQHLTFVFIIAYSSVPCCCEGVRFPLCISSFSTLIDRRHVCSRLHIFPPTFLY